MSKQIKIGQLKPFKEAPLHKNFKDMLNYSADKYKDVTAFILKHKIGRDQINYEYITYEAFRNQVARSILPCYSAYSYSFYQRRYKSSCI